MKNLFLTLFIFFLFGGQTSFSQVSFYAATGFTYYNNSKMPGFASSIGIGFKQKSRVNYDLYFALSNYERQGLLSLRNGSPKGYYAIVDYRFKNPLVIYSAEGYIDKGLLVLPTKPEKFLAETVLLGLKVNVLKTKKWNFDVPFHVALQQFSFTKIPVVFLPEKIVDILTLIPEPDPVLIPIYEYIDYIDLGIETGIQCKYNINKHLAININPQFAFYPKSKNVYFDLPVGIVFGNL